MFSVHDATCFLESGVQFSSADVFMDPPGDGQQSDVDSGDEDEGKVELNVNRLSRRQLQTRATCTLRTEKGKETVCETNYEEEDSADELLKSPKKKKSRQKKKPAAQSEERKWKKSDFVPKNSYRKYKAPERDETLAEISPTTAFEAFFDDEVVDYLCTETNRYAHAQGKHNFSVDREEMRGFLTILLLTKYVFAQTKDVLGTKGGRGKSACPKNYVEEQVRRNFELHSSCG